jgi:Zn-dependent protease with chaperone function/Zn-finger nucleic acid-binding protein
MKMQCPKCYSPLEPSLVKGSVIVDKCSKCNGVWLDKGELFFLVKDKKPLESYSTQGLTDPKPSLEKCPSCKEAALSSGFIPGFKHEVEECPSCKGLWLDKHEFQKVEKLESLTTPVSPGPVKRTLLKPLPSLATTSAMVLGSLYAVAFGFVVFLIEGHFIKANSGIFFLLGFVGLQFFLGPILMDWSLRVFGSLDWVTINQLPPHLQTFLNQTCSKYKIPIPTFGIINDGTPQAYTYGRTPRSARLVLSKGLIQVLSPEELEAVVAHELGHIYHWDFVWMTLAQIIPLFLYQIYRFCLESSKRSSGKKNKKGGNQLFWAGIVAYIAYLLSEYIVLFLSRVREYWADRFSVEATGNPNALVTALTKIAYGLVSSGPEPAAGKKTADSRNGAVQALGILNIHQSKSMALYLAQGLGDQAKEIAEVMQWDLWNPWASYYELHSTHPLTAKRILAISNQALHLGLSPSIIFSQRKPESFWDDFFVDLLVELLPLVIGFAFAGISYSNLRHGIQPWVIWDLLIPFFTGLGVGGIIQTLLSFPRGPFLDCAVSSLLKKIKVSPVTSYPVRVTGQIIGRGQSGNIFSEDLVLKDKTGMIFLDFTHGISNLYFALFKVDEYRGKEVTIEGWYRRAPIPYIELKRIISPTSTARSYSFYYRLLVWALLPIIAFSIRIFL